MRTAFLDQLYEIARDDDRVVLIIAGGIMTGSLDQWQRNIPAQLTWSLPTEMVRLAGMRALKGAKPYCCCGVSLGGLDQIKDLCCHPLPVTILGVGAGLDLGKTHNAIEDIGVMRALPNMTIFNPADKTAARFLVDLTYNWPGPTYVRLEREPQPDIYTSISDLSIDGFKVTPGVSQTLMIVATGSMVHTAHEIACRVKPAPTVVDLYQLKPVPIRFIQYLKDFMPDYVVTLEEHVLSGGLGSILAEIKADEDLPFQLMRLGIPDIYCFAERDREAMLTKCGIDKGSLVEKIKGLGGYKG